jgi:uncharacterized protein (DUF362 family)
LALEDALGPSRFDSALEAASGGPRADARVLVKPVLPPGTAAQIHPLRYTDPQLVESLIAWLDGRGWNDLTVAVSGPGGQATARKVGYRADVVDRYVVDLTSETEAFHYGGLIGEHEVAKAWLNADARILIGKSSTDRQLLYVGALIGALACVPNSDELARRIAGAHDMAVCASDILEKLPVDFGLIEAWHSAEGSGPPVVVGLPRATKAVLASPDLLALDWVLGELMDLDGPELNPVVREALHRRGPLELTRLGSLDQWEPWRNPGALIATLSDLGAGRRWGRLVGAKGVPWTAR